MKERAYLCPGLAEGLQEEGSLHLEILPPWESALKWGLGGVEPGSIPSGHSGEIAFTCAPAADSALASGGQSEVQAMIQQIPYSKKTKANNLGTSNHL